MPEPTLLQQQREILHYFRNATQQREQLEQSAETQRKQEQTAVDNALKRAQAEAEAQRTKAVSNQELQFSTEQKQVNEAWQSTRAQANNAIGKLQEIEQSIEIILQKANLLSAINLVKPQPEPLANRRVAAMELNNAVASAEQTLNRFTESVKELLNIRQRVRIRRNRFILASVIVVTILGVYGCNNFMDARNRALAPIRATETAIADVELFNKAIQLNPDDAEAYRGRGYAFVNQGKLEEAITDYTKAIQLDPDNSFTYFSRGGALAKQGKQEEAIADYTKAIQLDPDYSFTYSFRGDVLADQGKLEEAITDYTKAIQLDPDNSFTYISRGDALAKQGKLEEAIADYTKIIQLLPDSSLGYHYRSKALANQGKLEEAIADYDKVIQLNPDDAAANNSVCWDYSLLQQPKKAIPYCDRAIKLDSSPSYYDSRGLAHALLGDFPEAIADFQKYVDYYGNHPETSKYVPKRKQWIAELKAGKNPFTEEVLKELQHE